MMKKDVLVQSQPQVHENIGEHIGFEMGARMVKDYYDKFGENQAHFVGRSIIEKILEQPDCVGIRMYKALNAKGEQTYVFVGIDGQGKAILEYTAINDSGSLTKETGIVANKFSPIKPGDGWFEWSF
ncbi:MAG: hypothetical protein M9933_06425 [Chitinophagaceae bacterium]|nr:hypothetical protein [Chitinophagaceae bacterium]